MWIADTGYDKSDRSGGCSWTNRAEDMNAIATLDTKTSSFFDHRDPKIVKMLSEAKRTT